MEVFKQLGREIEDRWRLVNYNEAELPSIAADALSRADVPSKVTIWEVAEWALGEYELPRQRDVHANFADPPVTVFSGLRFHIDVYFWFEATTAIHQHGFCGAFQVMNGSSIHSWYDFEKARSINKFAEVGSMSLKKCELLGAGDIQEIAGGRDYIHSLFHLDRPSATIVVRTDRSPLHLPQYSYHKPNLAIDPFFELETVTKKLQIAAALIRADHEEADNMISRWIETFDFKTTYQILTNLRQMLRSTVVDEMFGLTARQARFNEFLLIAENRHGSDVFRPVFEHQNKIDAIVRRRQVVTDAAHRFFLALMLNVDGRDQIFSLIKQRFSDADPIEKVLDWTYDLANTRIAGDEKTNALGIPGFDDIDLYVFEQILNGRSGDEITTAFRAEHGEPTAAHALAEKEQRIRDSVIFQPLLS
ncbi:MAG: hypothetical protein IPK01_07355 [Acidobacteria bacterium]|nr:hypothetical protein [Acidobacteriota bacterium]